MASKTIDKILEAEQIAAGAVSQAQAEAGRILEAAREEALRTLTEEGEKTGVNLRAIAGQAQAEAARLNKEAEQTALAKAEALRESALRKLDSAQDLVISMMIPE